jgi:2-oxoisovalerate dehydrogenase E1 component alpha subunit
VTQLPGTPGGSAASGATTPAPTTPAPTTPDAPSPAPASPGATSAAPSAPPPTASSTTAGTELVQLLTPEGERVSSPDYDIDLTDDEYRELYRDLVLVRRIDVEATALQRQGELGIWAALLGQEAAQVGSGRALRPQDFAFPTYREHGVAWCKGVDPLQLLGLFRGVDHGGWDPQDKRFALYTIVIGSQTLHATGYAMGITKDGAVGGTPSQPDGGEAVIAYFGDGASSQGDVNEAFVWASVYNAPVVFFCQNNQWGISTPTDHQTRIPLYRRAEGFGFPGVRVDGNDVLASYAVTRAALDAARSGQGPTLVEAFTYRMGAHTTSDDPTRYRLASELEAWKLKDPLERMKSFLYKSQLVDSDFFAQLEADADALAARLRKGCLEMPDPDPARMFEHVYAEQTPLVAGQREQFAAYTAGFADDSPAGGRA